MTAKTPRDLESIAEDIAELFASSGNNLKELVLSALTVVQDEALFRERLHDEELDKIAYDKCWNKNGDGTQCFIDGYRACEARLLGDKDA